MGKSASLEELSVSSDGACPSASELRRDAALRAGVCVAEMSPRLAAVDEMLLLRDVASNECRRTTADVELLRCVGSLVILWRWNRCCCLLLGFVREFRRIAIC